MLKKGFTLAEVLVTLGIIGVVAALTTPALIQNVGNAKIGPRLLKAKATWENACEMMLNEENSNSILGVSRSFEGLGNTLSNYMKITKVDCYDIRHYGATDVLDGSIHGSHSGGNPDYPAYSVIDNAACYESDDKMLFRINGVDYSDAENLGSRNQWYAYINNPHHQWIGDLVVDINGTEKPNTMAKDVFVFSLMNDGSLFPKGSNAAHSSLYNARYWKLHGCNETSVEASGDDLCAGSIFDNGMKIIYE